MGAIMRDKRGNRNLYVRWTIYGDPVGIEGDLILFLEPAFNSRWEDTNLTEDEALDPRFTS